MLEKIKEITAESLGADAGTITEETSFKEDLGADSLDLFDICPLLRSILHTDLSVAIMVHKVCYNADPYNQCNPHKRKGQIVPPVLKWMENHIQQFVLPVCQCHSI